MKCNGLKFMISVFLMLSIVMSTFGVISFANTNDTGLVLDVDFEDKNIGDQTMTGVVEKYGKSKALKIKVGRANTTLKFDSLVVGECAMSFDFAAMPKSIKGEMCIMSGATPAYVLQFTEDGRIITKNGRELTRYGEKFKTVCVVFDTLKECFDVYIDGVLRASRLVYHVGGSDKVAHFSLAFAAVEDEAVVYLDNIHAYPTYEKTTKGKIFNPSAKPKNDKKIILSDKTVNPSDQPQRTHLADVSTIHMRSGVAFDGKTKIISEFLPYYFDDEYMVPKDVLSHALKKSIEVSDGKIRIGKDIELSLGKKEMLVGNNAIEITVAPAEKDGALYIPLKAVIQATGKKITYDDTAIHSGLIVISDAGFSMPVGEELQKINDFCFYFRPTKEKFLEDYNASSLKGVHPRIIATESDFDRIRKEAESNSYKKKWKENLYAACDRDVDKPAVKYELPDGVRLMTVADSFREYMYKFGMAYQLSKYEEPERAKKYFDAAWKHIESVANMPDWNPPHHLDVGIMARGYAIAYDWFYEAMTPEQRQIMEKGAHDNLFYIWNLGSQSEDSLLGSVRMFNNHNQIMNGGAMMCVLSFMDVYPEIASKLGADICQFMEISLDKFYPLGSYAEGPSYSTMATDYQSAMLAAMKPILGTCYSLDRPEGFEYSCVYLSNIRSDVSAYTFSDTPYIKAYTSSAFWMFDYYDQKGYKDSHAEFFKNYDNIDAVQGLLYYDVSIEDDTVANSSLDQYYDSVGVLTMRNSFDDGQVFVGLTAGYHAPGHDHLDGGSFVYDALGTRWAEDLGSDDYNLYYKYNKWDVFRLRPESHNVLLVNPDKDPGYSLTDSGYITDYQSKDRGVIVKMEMGPNYDRSDVSKARRGFFLTDDRRSLVVRDEVSFPAQSDAYWIMVTAADVEIVDSHTVILTDSANKEKKVKVEWLSSSPGQVEVGPAQPFATSPQVPEQKPNIGYSRLYYKFTGKGVQSVTAKITPLGFGGTDISMYDTNMDKWSIPDGSLNKIPELDSLTIGGESYSVKNRYLTITVPNEESPVPEIMADSSEYKVTINNAEAINDVSTVVMTNKQDSSDSITYYIAFTPKIKKRVFEGYTALKMNNVVASEEPQEANPKEHVLDGRLDTRWSAENIQWLLFDLENEQSFDTLFMAMYDGDIRYNEFTVDISNDGEKFTEVGRFTTSGKTEDYESYNLGSQRARYVRVNFFGNSSGTWNSPTELALAKKN